MTGAMCVRCHRWTDNPVMVGTWVTATGPGWSQYAHPEGDPACGQPPPEGQGEDEEPDPAALYDRGRARGAHRRPRRILDDLPRGMPGGLLAAFGWLREHGAAVALAALLWPLPAWLVAPQAMDAMAADRPGRAAPDPTQAPL